MVDSLFFEVCRLRQVHSCNIDLTQMQVVGLSIGGMM